jgi:hypothetical protein
VTDGVDVVTTNPRDLRVADGAPATETEPSRTATRSPDVRVSPTPQPSSGSVVPTLARAAVALIGAGALIAAGFVVARTRRNRPRPR